MSNSILSYQTYGDKSKPAIVFLHGFMGSKNDWQYIAEYYSDSKYCITIDLPGHWNSIGIDDKYYDIESTGLEIINILDELNVDKVNLLGYSMGGRIALYFAMNHPDRINKLILESSSPGLKTEKERAVRRKNDSKLADRIINSDFETFLHDWYDLPFFKSMKSHPKYEEIIKKRLENDIQGITKSLKYIGTGSQPSLWNEWENSKVESLLISGELDSKYCAINKEMSKLNPHSKHIIVKNAGHNVHFERRELLIKYVDEFLSE